MVKRSPHNNKQQQQQQQNTDMVSSKINTFYSDGFVAYIEVNDKHLVLLSH